MVVAAVLGALAGAAALVAAYGGRPALVLDMDTDLPSIARGFYPVEKDPAGLTFAWTRGQAELALPGFDRRSPWAVTVRFRGGRADETSLPDMQLAVDGRVQAAARATNAFQELHADIPASGGERGTVITLLVSSTFVPGPGDPRALGVMVDQVRIAPAGDAVALVPRRTLGGAMLGAGAFGLAFGAIGLASVPAVAAAVLVAAGQAAAMVHGTGPYMPYGGNMAWFAGAIALLLVTGVMVVERATRRRLRNTARFAAAFAAGVLYLELLVLLHPSMPIGDAMFQAHRFELVLSGRYLFTSIAPGGYQFPYAIGLYLVAAPFTAFVHGVAGLIDLLRIVVAASNVLAGLLVYLMVLRASGDRVAAAIATAVYHLVPLNFLVQYTGNLTNAFGQSLFLVTIALVSLGVVRHGHVRGLIAGTAVALAASLSHTSTFAILVPVLLLVAVLFAWRGNAVLRTSAAPIALVAAVGALAAVALYYGHFGDIYREQAARIAAELGRPAAEADPGGRSVADRARLVPHYLRTYYGLPLLVLAAGGVAWLWRRRQRDRFALTVAGWAAGCAGFLALGVLTPVDMRYYLAFFPAVAMLAALGGAWLWRSGPVARGIALALFAWAVSRGIWEWLAPLIGRAD
jgi:hypothetical protein